MIIGRELTRVVTPAGWLEADPRGRALLLARAHDHVRAQFGMSSGRISVAFDWPQARAGVYLRKDDRVVVNARLLERSDPSEALRTVVHEARHAVQCARLAGKVPLPYPSPATKEELEIWRESQYNYGTDSPALYAYNPLEVDAEWSARIAVEDGYWAQIRLRDLSERTREVRR